MPKKITSVEWTASNIPSGLSFNESTGTFSGTATDVGEYTVPVTVKTNYGTDTKDLTVRVEGRAYPVYVIGSKAATWSNNAEPDEYGFRKLDMPDAYRLSTVCGGFAGKVGTSRWYAVGGLSALSWMNDAEFSEYGVDPSVGLVELPLSGIQEICGSCSIDASRSKYVMYKMSDGTVIVHVTNDTGTSAGYPHYALNKAKMVQRYFGQGLGYVNIEGKVCNGSYASAESRGAVKEIFGEYNSNTNKYNCYYLTTSGELWYETFAGEPDRLCDGLGHITGIWPYASMTVTSNNTGTLFVLTSGNDLYARGRNASYQLGLPEAKQYKDFENVGNYKVKKIDSYEKSTFMLTEDGKLYHSGNKVTGVTETHTSFTQIYPDKTFQDIAYANTANTLVVMMED